MRHFNNLGSKIPSNTYVVVCTSLVSMYESSGSRFFATTTGIQLGNNAFDKSRLVQRKAFYGQRIPKSNCATKKTFDIDIFITSRNGD